MTENKTHDDREKRHGVFKTGTIFSWRWMDKDEEQDGGDDCRECCIKDCQKAAMIPGPLWNPLVQPSLTVYVSITSSIDQCSSHTIPPMTEPTVISMMEC